jgi:hypothetical protein
MANNRTTNAGMQTKGVLLAGLDPMMATLFAGSFIVSMALTYGLVVRFHFSWIFSAFVFFVLPNGGLALVTMTLIIGKPPGYLRDWIESYLLGSDSVDASRLRPLDPPPPV